MTGRTASSACRPSCHTVAKVVTDGYVRTCPKTSASGTDQVPWVWSATMLARWAATRARPLRPALSGRSMTPWAGRPPGVTMAR